MNFAAVSSGLSIASGEIIAAAMSADMLAMVRFYSSRTEYSLSKASYSSPGQLIPHAHDLPVFPPAWSMLNVVDPFPIVGAVESYASWFAMHSIDKTNSHRGSI